MILNFVLTTLLMSIISLSNAFNFNELVSCDQGTTFSKCVIGDKISGDGKFNDGVYTAKCGNSQYAMKVINNNNKIINEVIQVNKKRRNVLRKQLSSTDPSADLTQVKAAKYDPFNRLTQIRDLLRKKQIKSFVPIEDTCGIKYTIVFMPLAIKPIMDKLCMIKLIDDVLELSKNGLVHDDIKEENIMNYNGMCSFIDHDSLCIEGENKFDVSEIPCIISEYIPLLKHHYKGDVYYLLKLIHDKIKQCDPGILLSDITEMNRGMFDTSLLRKCRSSLFNDLTLTEKDKVRAGFYKQELEDDIF